jgi:hypothetical protein
VDILVEQFHHFGIEVFAGQAVRHCLVLLWLMGVRAGRADQGAVAR